MPLELEKLYNSRNRTATLQWDADEVKIEYRMMAITPRKVNEIVEASTTPRELFVGWILEFVVDWDIVAGGEKCPITAEFLSGLRSGFLAAVYEAMIQDPQNPNAGDDEKKS